MINLSKLSQLDWRNPWWLILALQPWLMHSVLRLRRSKIHHYADIHLLPWVLRGSLGTRPSEKGRSLANIMVWLLLAGAAAGPRDGARRHRRGAVLLQAHGFPC